MNILFITIARFEDVEKPGIYTDLMRKFRDEGHNVYVVMPLERGYHELTMLRENKGIHILGVKTLNIQKTNMIEKGLGYLLVERQFARAIHRYLKDVRFDLVTYSTPPITLGKTVEFVKNRDGARSYLQLKDIFPQNAIDIGLMSKNTLWKFFVNKERKLYEVSDYIGCMSPRNVEYLLEQNPWLDKSCVEVMPNSEADNSDGEIAGPNKIMIRDKYGIPQDKLIFVYGGNLGKPQGIPFLIEALKANHDNDKAHFVIVGAGTEYSKLEKFVNEERPTNVTLHSALPREEYESLVKACDVGLICLDHRFTIPNYPSRLLAYLKNRMPILSATDRNTDIGTMAEENGYGYCAFSDDIASFNAALKKYTNYPESVTSMGEKGYQYFLDNYTIEKSYDIIMNHFDIDSSL